jgi:uncharacterized membrane protein YjfL (UPF0719 family)
MILQSLAGLPAFLVYFCIAIIAVVAYLLVYTRITPHNEFQLIRDNTQLRRSRSASACSALSCPWSARLRIPPMSWIA